MEKQLLSTQREDGKKLELKMSFLSKNRNILFRVKEKSVPAQLNKKVETIGTDDHKNVLLPTIPLAMSYLADICGNEALVFLLPIVGGIISMHKFVQKCPSELIGFFILFFNNRLEEDAHVFKRLQLLFRLSHILTPDKLCSL